MFVYKGISKLRRQCVLRRDKLRKFRILLSHFQSPYVDYGVTIISDTA